MLLRIDIQYLHQSLLSIRKWKTNRSNTSLTFIMTTEYFYCKELTFKAHQSFHVYFTSTKICQLNFISIDCLNFTRKKKGEGLCLQATKLISEEVQQWNHCESADWQTLWRSIRWQKQTFIWQERVPLMKLSRSSEVVARYHMLLWLLWWLYSFFRLNKPELFSYSYLPTVWACFSSFRSHFNKSAPFCKREMACNFLFSIAIFISPLSVSGMHLYQTICYLNKAQIFSHSEPYLKKASNKLWI